MQHLIQIVKTMLCTISAIFQYCSIIIIRMNQTAAQRINLGSSKVNNFEFLDGLNIPNRKRKNIVDIKVPIV